MRAARSLVVFGITVGLGLMGGVGADDAAARSACEASYPKTSLTPSRDIGDLDCGDALTVIHDERIGAVDSHGLDADSHGIGCEIWSSYGKY